MDTREQQGPARSSAVLGSPVLVGREQESAALRSALSRAPSLVLIEGEAGIGKSRLVREVVSGSGAGGVLVAACPPFRQPYTLGPIVEAARGSLGAVAPMGLSGLAGALRPLFPEWSERLPPLPEPAEDASAARHRVFRALAELFAAQAVRVLVVEDVHWADDATLEFLLFLMSRQDTDLGLVVTYRPEDVPADSLLRRLASRQLSTGAPTRIELGAFDPDATAALVSSITGEGISSAFGEFIYKHTEGVPLAIEEVLRLLHDRGDLIRSGQGWLRRELDVIAVPSGVRDAVLERAERLSIPAGALLGAAAVLGEPSPVAVAVQVSGLAPETAEQGLAEALRSGLLQVDARQVVSFRHVLAARAIYDAIPEPERQEAHHRAGRALASRWPQPAAQLARHFRAAGEHAAWHRYGEQAADAAAAAGDWRSASTLLCDLVVDGDLNPDELIRAVKKMPLQTFTDLDRLAEITKRVSTVLETAELSAGLDAELRVQRARVWSGLGDHEAAAADLEAAIPHLDHDPVAAAEAMTRLGWPMGTLWPAVHHRRWLDRAAAVAVQRSPAEQLSFLVYRVSALLFLGERDGWLEAATIRTHPGTPQETRQATVGQLNVADGAMRWGHYAEASRRLAVARELAADPQYDRLRTAFTSTQAHLDWFTGDWRGLAEQVERLTGDDEDIEVNAHHEATLVRGLLATAAGEHRRAEVDLTVAHDWAAQTRDYTVLVEPAAALTRLYLARNQVAAALQISEHPMRIVTVKQIWIWAAELGPARVEALVVGGHVTAAAELAEAFADGVAEDMPAAWAAVLTCRALVSRAQGQYQRAASLFGEASAAWARLPRPYDALLNREEQARCQIAAGDLDGGVSALCEVHAGLAALPATADADRVAQTLQQQGIRVRRDQVRRGRRGYGDQLSPRETDVARLVVAGMTNRQIGDALRRSPATVATQVKSAMRKLGVSSRASLAARLAASQAGATHAGGGTDE